MSQSGKRNKWKRRFFNEIDTWISFSRIILTLFIVFTYFFFTFLPFLHFYQKVQEGEVSGNTSFSSVRSRYEIVNLSSNLALDSLKVMVFRITLLWLQKVWDFSPFHLIILSESLIRYGDWTLIVLVLQANWKSVSS